MQNNCHSNLIGAKQYRHSDLVLCLTMPYQQSLVKLGDNYVGQACRSRGLTRLSHYTRYAISDFPLLISVIFKLILNGYWCTAVFISIK
jgi:hypothetical protein